MLMKSPTWLAGLMVCGMSAAARAEPNAELMSELQQTRKELAQLKQEMAGLRASQGDNWLNERRAEEVKALVREVLADADTRASLMQTGMTAGWNKKFFLASEDGRFLLNFGGRIQFRYVANFRDDNVPAAHGGDSGETGFQIRRIKPSFDGYIGSPKFGYKIVLAADRASNSVGLEEAVISYQMGDVTFYGGRTKAPFLREELTSSGKQMAVERSIVNEIFTAGFTEGAGVVYKGDLFQVFGWINDGANSGEVGGTTAPPFGASPSNSDFMGDVTDFAATARVDFKLAGDWKQMEDFNAWTKEEMGVFLGTAVHWELAETGSGTAPTVNNNEFIMWTVDGSVETGGLGVFGAFIMRHDLKVAPGATKFDDKAFIVQAGYMVIPDKLEPFARYEYIMLDGGRGAENVSIYTVGVNYYFIKHNAKFSLDVVYSPDPLTVANISGSSSGYRGQGLLTDAADEEDQVAVRAQFQVQW